MMDWIKKIFAFLNAIPAFTSLFRSASTTGKIDPVETIHALSSISPGTKKIADTAMNVTQQGGGIQEVAQAIKNVGDVEIMGTTVNTKTLTQDLKRAGGICAALGNMLDKLQNQSPQEVVEFGTAATDVNSWKEVINQAK